MNISASGRPVVYTGIAIFRIADGKIVEQWQEADLMGLMLQLSESTWRTMTEPLGQRETEGLQHTMDVTAPMEEIG